MPAYKELDVFDRLKKNMLRMTFDSFPSAKGENAYKLLAAMLDYNPDTRISADDALVHHYFADKPNPGQNSFIAPPNKSPWMKYPLRKVHNVN